MVEYPVIVCHLSYKEYVKVSVIHNSQRNNVHLLTNDIQNYYDVSNNITLVDITQHLYLLEDFKKKYIHASPNSPTIEMTCIMRWVFIYNYMKESGIENAFICDSDVLIYDDINDVIPRAFFEDGCVLCTCPKHKIVSGGQSVWNINKLGSFVDFIYDFYKTQADNIKNTITMPRKQAGVSDMTLLYYFIHNRKEFIGLHFENKPHPKYALNDVYVVPNSNHLIAFDLHLDTHGSHKYPNEWAMGKDGRKILKFRYGKPYGFNIRLKKWIQFSLLHFQGRNKPMLKYVYDIGNKTNDYWMKHDPVFLSMSDLSRFNYRIKEFDINQENHLILNMLLTYPINSVFIDVGAYKGDTSIKIARELKKYNREDIHIICIEPNKTNCNDIITHSVCEKLNISVVQSVCSDTSGTVYMKKNEGSGTMYDSVFNGDSFPCNTLDNLVSDIDVSSNIFLKIDVEGHEPQVLSGASRILSQTKHIYIELWNDDHYLERHTNPPYISHNKEVLKYIANHFLPLQKIEKNVLFISNKN